ncbi:cell envelope biogenesis protein OmpA [Flexivirga sp. ID2601S]|uniref:Cell envelope biogenesis protein OmpA n=1 Tax=Flexivirga aerilata TaxID=1656889 RepID=A0A849AF43_9MICO|nr:DUF6069 family protein [Flexivirga aerilata]NNG39474.1 cell envelope biogenesis protein OmpA [Flexivirga aerilata]
MSTSISNPTTSSTATAASGSTATPAIWKAGVAAAAGATLATTGLAALASAAGVSFEAGGSAIPLLGFTQLTAVFSLVGVAMAVVMSRVARRPRRTFVRTTVALTALSVVPDATFGFDVASAAVLMTLHLVAALIVIPVVARRLATTR